MAGAVVVIEPGLPEREAGQRIELRAAWCPSGSGRVASAIWPFEHAGEAVAHLPVGVPIADGAGDVGGAVAEVGAPESTR